MQVEVWPTSMVFKKGHRIRLDIQPRDGVHSAPYTHYSADYNDGQNTIYSGGDKEFVPAAADHSGDNKSEMSSRPSAARAGTHDPSAAFQATRRRDVLGPGSRPLRGLGRDDSRRELIQEQT